MEKKTKPGFATVTVLPGAKDGYLDVFGSIPKKKSPDAPRNPWYPLEEGDTILLKNREEDSAEEHSFRILGQEGSGSRIWCYRALKDGRWGRLKEFCPAVLPGGVSLARTWGRQTVSVGTAGFNSFAAQKKDFVETYRRLEKLLRTEGAGLRLNNYVPTFELWYGMDSAAEAGECATVYLWMPGDDQGVVLKNRLRTYEKELMESPLFVLEEVTEILLTLADALGALHEGGFLHMDVKPSNFLVGVDGDGEVQTGRLSMFDLNSICPGDGSESLSMGSRGYRAPEMTGGLVTPASDLYSVGAILYSALAKQENGDLALYQDISFARLERRVRELPWWERVPRERREDICGWVVRILRNCLNPLARKRYQDAAALRKDLKTLKKILR